MKEPAQRIGLLGGSFDPIHYGHFHLAREMMNHYHLSEVWFIPAKVSPHKLEAPPAPLHHRMEMLRLALDSIGEPRFKLEDIEARSGNVSYTVDTLRELTSHHPNARFFLLLGDDTISGFERWKEPKEILKLCTLAVGSREGEGWKKISDSDIIKAVKSHYHTLPICRITSTEIRDKIAHNEDCSSLLPPVVQKYILDNKIYR